MRHTLRWSATPRTVFYPIATYTVKLRVGRATHPSRNLQLDTAQNHHGVVAAETHGLR